MPKYAKDKRKYRKEWETESWGKGWVQHISNAKNVDANDANEAHCKLCNVSLRSHIADLKKHSTSKKHKLNAASLKQPRKQTLLSHGYELQYSIEKKKTDIKLALHIVMHSSIQSIDHLGEMLSVLGKGSVLENTRLHRTKCSSLVKHVIAPALLTGLIKAVGENSYSIVIDESTDVSVTKYLCICIRYFDIAENRMVTTFLGILEVERATADALYTSIIEYFTKIGLPLMNLTAIGTDGGSNLCGRNHSVYTLLKERVPKLQLLRCTCHSLHLCASKASEELPSSLDFLAREVYNWFSVSSLRRINYRKTFDLINEGNDSQKFRQVIQLSRTRWLAFYEVVKRLLEQWLELKTHFQLACDTERCYTARIIRDMLEDDANRMYLIFLQPVLAEIQHLNLSFQSENVDVGSLYEEMILTFLSFAKRILKPVFLHSADNNTLVRQVLKALGNDLAFLPITETDLGTDFEKALAESTLSAEVKGQIKQRSFNFLRKLLREMAQRLPTNLDIFRNYKLLSPSFCLSPVRAGLNPGHKSIGFEELPLKDFFDPHCPVSVYKSQWDKLSFVNWDAHFGGNIPTNILLFWPAVYKYTDASGRLVFKELAELVLKMLVIPTSNAVVERAFSALTLIKTRIRNRLQTPMLQALLRIRLHFKAFNKCCKTFEPSSEMLERFKSSYMYGSTTESAVNRTDEENETDTLTEILEIMSELD